MGAGRVRSGGRPWGVVVGVAGRGRRRRRGRARAARRRQAGAVGMAAATRAAPGCCQSAPPRISERGVGPRGCWRRGSASLRVLAAAHGAMAGAAALAGVVAVAGLNCRGAGWDPLGGGGDGASGAGGGEVAVGCEGAAGAAGAAAMVSSSAAVADGTAAPAGKTTAACAASPVARPALWRPAAAPGSCPAASSSTAGSSRRARAAGDRRPQRGRRVVAAGACLRRACAPLAPGVADVSRPGAPPAAEGVDRTAMVWRTAPAWPRGRAQAARGPRQRVTWSVLQGPEVA